MRLWHSPARTSATFDDPNLVSCSGLVPVMALAERCGLAGLVRRHVQIAARTGVNADLKVPCLVAGMAAGADSIDDMGVLRHGAMGTLFGGIRAPSTLGSFLRSFTWGNVRQLEAAGRVLLSRLAAVAPLLPGKDVLAFIDIGSMQKRVYGHAKDGAAFGHTKIQGKSLLVRGLNVLAAVVSTPLSAPVIAATRLRGGSAGSARGAASLAAEAISTARAAGCTGQLVFRIDSAYYSAAVLGAIRARPAARRACWIQNAARVWLSGADPASLELARSELGDHIQPQGLALDQRARGERARIIDSSRCMRTIHFSSSASLW